MKEKIIIIFNKLKSLDYFENSIFSFTSNYERIIEDFRKVVFKDVSIEDLKLDEKEIKSFNLTLNIDRGIDHTKNIEDIYADDWKSVYFTFYGKKKLKYSFRTLGARESFRLEEKMKNEKLKCKIEDIDNVISTLIEIDELLDEQYLEKQKLFKKL